MLVSYKWLQTYFKEVLPAPRELGAILNTRAFEVEGVTSVGDDFTIDVDVQPNRAHDCLCHEGIAKEIGVLTGLPFEPQVDSTTVGKTTGHATPFSVVITEGVQCARYSATLLEGIVVGEAVPVITERLQVLGQRSINHVVDSANYVLFEMGQPTHAFDADKITGDTLYVRHALAGETMTTLDGKDIVFRGGEMVIADAEVILAIAGIKGGKKAEVTSTTKRVLLESANFNASTVRATSSALGISTDASKRFERGLSPVLVQRGMERLVERLREHAPSIVVYETLDVYPRPVGVYKTGVSVSQVQRYLGIPLTAADIEHTLTRLGFAYTKVIPQDAVVSQAIDLVGKAPYKYGASVLFDAPRAFDCSSFVSYLYKEAGVSLPRVAVDQYMWGTPVTKEELMPGDVVFCDLGASAVGADKQFYHTKTIDFMPGTVVPEKLDHNGIYIGNGEVVHASSKAGNTVACERLEDSVIFSHIAGYRRMATRGEERYVITVPDERLDIRIPADVIEEIARVYGYEHIAPKPLTASMATEVHVEYAYLNMLRTKLVAAGFSEIMTPTFVATGDIEVVKAIASDKGFLRTNLTSGIRNALALNEKNTDLLGVDRVRVFEIGHVFTNTGEELRIALGVSGKKADAVLAEVLAQLELQAAPDQGVAEVVVTVPIDMSDVMLQTVGQVAYQSFSLYPYMVRDIAFWVSGDARNNRAEEFINMIKQTAGALLVRTTLFDVFEKEERTSYAFRLVFQASDRTLTDEEVGGHMDAITKTFVDTYGFEVR
jgi:phenylalanyl-tRNA synthetase beta subunit